MSTNSDVFFKQLYTFLDQKKLLQIKLSNLCNKYMHFWRRKFGVLEKGQIKGMKVTMGIDEDGSSTTKRGPAWIPRKSPDDGSIISLGLNSSAAKHWCNALGCNLAELSTLSRKQVDFAKQSQHCCFIIWCTGYIMSSSADRWGQPCNWIIIMSFPLLLFTKCRADKSHIRPFFDQLRFFCLS